MLSLIVTQYDFFTSKECDNGTRNKQGRNRFESNIRAVAAFREIGRGYNALSNFCRVINMKGVSNHTTFDSINELLIPAYQEFANESMSTAAASVYTASDKDSEGHGLRRVSLDGSRQKRGHASLNGIVTTISNGKCIDVETMTKYCRGCAMWEKKKKSPWYDMWKAEHVCTINHTKSSGAMEGSGATSMFNRSIAKHNLIYREYLGDGDSSSFKEVVDSEPYKQFSVTPKKLECVGHVQKRVGTRLRKLIKSYQAEETIIKNGKKVKKIVKLSDKEKLTETIINSLQNYYGIAIRANKGNRYAMKKAVGAALMHCTNFESTEARHRFCPLGPNTWCKWRINKEYKSKINIPRWIHKVIYPMFVELSSDELLDKCLHGETQNANKAINQIIWNKLPKNVFVGRRVLEMGVNSALIEFNDGSQGIEKVLQAVGVKNGSVTRKKPFCGMRQGWDIAGENHPIRGKKEEKQSGKLKKGLLMMKGRQKMVAVMRLGLTSDVISFYDIFLLQLFL